MDRFVSMKIFVKVAETGSFAEAARALYMSAPAVTRAVASLEELIGTRLFIRTTRAVKITEAGAKYLEDCKRILAAVEASDSAAHYAHAEPAGVLTVTAPALFGQQFVLPIVIDYLAVYPNVSGRTLFSNRVTHLIDEDIDVAIRIGHLPDSSYHAVRVGSVRNVVVAAPTYFERNGIPHRPQDLTEHTIVAAANTWIEQEWRFGNPTRGLTVHPRLLCSSDESAIAAVLTGWGLTRMMTYKVAHYLSEGRLQTVLSEFEEPPVPIHVLHSEGRHASAKVRLFIDQLVERLRANALLN